MKRIYFTVLCTCTLVLNSVQAQQHWSIGIDVGYTNNEFYTNISNYEYSYYKKEGGCIISMPLQYAVRDWFAIQAEPGFIQKSFSLWQTLQTAEPTHLKSTYEYLQLPVMAHFSFGSHKWKGFMNIGGYSAYWVSGHIKGTEVDNYNVPFYPPALLYLPQKVDSKYEFDDRRDRRLQFGFLAGAGVEYMLCAKYSVFAESRYYQDQTEQQKSYMHNQVPRYNNTIAITAGCIYHFSATKH